MRMGIYEYVQAPRLKKKIMWRLRSRVAWHRLSDSTKEDSYLEGIIGRSRGKSTADDTRI